LFDDGVSDRLGLVLAGAVTGRAIAIPRSARGETLALAIFSLPFLLAAAPRRSAVRVRDSIGDRGSAPIETVWAKRRRFFPRSGAARVVLPNGDFLSAPRANRRTGEGAIRYCDFSTGSFVEPITRGRRRESQLRREVLAPPDERAKPVRKSACPDLDGFLNSKAGESFVSCRSAKIDAPGGKHLVRARHSSIGLLEALCRLSDSFRSIGGVDPIKDVSERSRLSTKAGG